MKDYSVLKSLVTDYSMKLETAYDMGYEMGHTQGYADGQADTPFTDTQRAEALAYERGLNDAWECARKLTHPVLGGFRDNEKTEIFGYPDSDRVLVELSASEAIEKIKKWEDKQKECFPEGNPFISKQDDTERSCSTCADSDKGCNDHNLHCDYSCWTPKQDDTKIENNGIYECSCGYGWDKTDVANVRFHFCPNCGKAVEEKKQDDTEIRVGDEVIYKHSSQKGVVLNIVNHSASVMFSDGVTYELYADSLIKTGKHYDIESIFESILKQMQEG